MNDKITTLDENDRPDNMLDRIWDATRPADLDDESFDRIWANVQHAYDNPTVLPMHSPQTWIAVSIAVLASAAAIFVAAIFVARPVSPEGPGLVQNDAKPAAQPVIVSTPYDLEPHETLVIEIDGNTVRDHRLEPDAKTWLALNDIPANNAADVLNWMEVHSND